MALERLNMHRKKVKNAVWLGVVGAIWCRFDLVENTSGLVLSIRFVQGSDWIWCKHIEA